MKETVLRTYHTRPVSNKAATVNNNSSSHNSPHLFLSDMEDTCDDELKSLVKKAVSSDYRIALPYTNTVIFKNSNLNKPLFVDQYHSYFPPARYIFQQVFRV